MNYPKKPWGDRNEIHPTMNEIPGNFPSGFGDHLLFVVALIILFGLIVPGMIIYGIIRVINFKASRVRILKILGGLFGLSIGSVVFMYDDLGRYEVIYTILGFILSVASTLYLIHILYGLRKSKS